MLLLDSSPGAGGYILQIIFVALSLGFVLWRLAVAAGEKNNGLHPFKKDFYLALLAERYWKKANKIHPKRYSPENCHQAIDLYDQAISYYPSVEAIRGKIWAYANLGQNSDLPIKEKNEFFKKGLDLCDELISMHPSSFEAHAMKVQYIRFAGNYEELGSFTQRYEAAYALGKLALRYAEKEDTAELYSFRCDMSKIAILLKKYQEALSYTKKANSSKWAYNSQEGFLFQSVALLLLRKWDESLQAYDNLSEGISILNSRNVPELAQRGKGLQVDLEYGNISEELYELELEKLLYNKEYWWST